MEELVTIAFDMHDLRLLDPNCWKSSIPHCIFLWSRQCHGQLTESDMRGSVQCITGSTRSTYNPSATQNTQESLSC